MQICLIFVIILYCIREINGYSCRSCAAPVLAEEWATTGLPTRPDGNLTAFFDEHCDQDSSSTGKCETNIGCFEGAFAISDQYAFVRGCLEQFIDGYEDLRSALTPSCNYAKSPKSVYVQKKHIESPYVGYSICTTDDCNHFITREHATQEVWGQANGVITCQRKDNVRCVECKYYDGYGHCWWDTRDYCSGAYCTKNIGSLNGRRYEIRGCSGIRPLNADYCYTFEDQHDIDFLGAQISFKNEGTQCVCEGGTCNGSRRESINFLMGISMILLISWLVM
ncbi:unnamed protein product [Bursaphelenchus xylophilus]|uniref:(pine wood nematode) hypothetical protein n=1 Tax=Bursaphelenchus xylophilus TaxID=6326 RepID=A0A1I7SCV2_BURXY|nr:unnamed protein product [Bursaphelenchus xylophilus]CAG9093429.1 unnamed protein product [Bursaphelenchus xylophilus]